MHVHRGSQIPSASLETSLTSTDRYVFSFGEGGGVAAYYITAIAPVVDLPNSAPYLVKMLMPPLQVGNAVPPPMAKAIGLEMKKCVEEKSKIAN